MAGDERAATTEQSSTSGADGSAASPDAGLAPTVPARAATDPRAAARAQLRALRHASAELARALMAAGYPPRRWQEPDPTLRELARDLPQPALAALFARLDRFSGEDGPTWLAGDATARADFTREAHRIDDILRPLRALALRRRAGSPSDHPARPLERLLDDPASGAQLDRLAQAADALVWLAPALASAPAEAAPRLVPVFAPTRAPIRAEPRAATPSATPSDAPTVIAQDAPTIPAERPFVPGAVVSAVSDRMSAGGSPVLPDAPAVLPDAPTVPWLTADATVPLPPGKVPRPRPRLAPLPALPALPALLPRLPLHPLRWRRPQWVVALAIVACLACAVAAIVQTFAPSAGPSARATPVATSAHATPPRALPTATPMPATSTPLPARLDVAPSFVALACPFADSPTTLTLRDTGGASLTWQIAHPPLTLVFATTRGSLAPGATAAVQVRAVLRQHGTHSFTVSSNGGSVAVSYTVCR